MDWSAVASWIALVVAVATPAITNYLNNLFQSEMKKLDFKFSKQSDYYNCKKSAYENFIKYASKQIESDYKHEKIDLCECFHEMLFYLPNENWEEANSLYKSIIERKPESKEKLYKFTKILAEQLKESWKQFPI